LGQLTTNPAGAAGETLPGDLAGGRVARVLICGGSTTAGRMLIRQLRAGGSEVCVYQEDPEIGVQDPGVTLVRGALGKVHLSEGLEGTFSAAVSFLSIAPGADSGEFDRLSSLVRFCRERRVPKLIHVEPVLRRPGAESPTSRVVENAPRELTIHIVRVGVLLGGLLEDPMIGIGVRLWNNRVLALGAMGERVPVSSTKAVAETIAELLANTGGPALTNRIEEASPTKREYLTACCQQLGAGVGVRGVPGWIWPAVSGLGWVASKLGAAKLEPWRVTDGAAPSSAGQRGFDWVRELTETVENQKPNFKSPHTTATPMSITAQKLSFVGPGAMTSRHAGALRKLGFKGRVVAYGDPNAEGFSAESRSLDAVDGADLHVVGPGGLEQLANLKDVPGAVLVDRPSCTDEAGWAELLSASRARGDAVYACHEHRFRANVTRLLDHIRRFNPGGLIHVDVDLQVPGTERGDLCELALPSLDLAMMFHGPEGGPWSVGPVRSRCDRLGAVDLVQGEFQSRTCSVRYVLRRGFVARRTVIRYVFQNYRALLTFGPDNFFAQHATDPWGFSSLGLRERLRGAIDAAGSGPCADDAAPTALAICAALGDLRLRPSIELARLTPFYEAWFQLRRAARSQA